MKKVYLCDGYKDCWMSPFCGVNSKDYDSSSCFHTKDINHAKNKNRKNYEMKFEKIDEDVLWEVE